MTTTPVRTEAQLLRFVKQAAQTFGFRTYHNLYAIGSDRGFPDLVMVRSRDGRLIVAELKGPRGRTTDEQESWLLDWRTVLGAEVFLWRSGDEDRILEILAYELPPQVCEPCGVAHP